MKLAIVAISLLVAVVFGANYKRQDGNVLRFDAAKTEKQVVDSVVEQLQKVRRLKTFQYNNCANPALEVTSISKLVISPDPLVFPGTFTVNFSGNANQVISSPINGVLVLEVKVANIWVKIPCINQIGSCTYPDLCQLLTQITQCPAPLVAAGIPCQCPFPQGPYNLSQASFNVDVALVPAGDYHVIANVTTGSTSVTCVELYISFG